MNGITIVRPSKLLALFNEENVYIFGINTILDKIDISTYIQKGYFEVMYKDIPLKNDIYYVKVGIFGESDIVKYDFLDKSGYFKVFSVNKNQGLIEINYKWK